MIRALAAFSVIMQLLCAVHAVKAGRYYWILLIVFFPVGGWMIYFFTHIINDWRLAKTIQDGGEKIASVIKPTLQLKKLKEQLKFCDTTKNKQLLAEEYMNLGGYEDAIILYKSCLEGVYADDPEMNLDLAQALFQSKSYRETLEKLMWIKKSHPNYKSYKLDLLLARTFDALGDTKQAIDQYKSMVTTSSGEEVRCRLALLLQNTGQIEEAKELYAEIISGSKRSPRYYRRLQSEWIKIAQQKLTELQQTASKNNF